MNALCKLRMFIQLLNSKIDFKSVKNFTNAAIGVALYYGMTIPAYAVTDSGSAGLSQVRTYITSTIIPIIAAIAALVIGGGHMLNMVSKDHLHKWLIGLTICGGGSYIASLFGF